MKVKISSKSIGQVISVENIAGDLVLGRAAPEPSDARPGEARAPDAPPIGSRQARILLVAANPAETGRLRLDAEAAAIHEALRSADHRDALSLSSTWAADFTRLLDALMHHSPHVLHFCGHGARGELRIEGASTLDTSVLAQLLAEVPTVRCVVLNACESVERVDELVRHVPCVIAMQGPVSDDGSRVFAAALYRALGYGRSLASAFRVGCAALGHFSPEERDIPRLHTAEGVDAEQLHLVSAS